MAIVNASITNWLVIRSLIAQPTIRREYKSNSVARYSQPSSVGMYVMSPTHARLGRT